MTRPSPEIVDCPSCLAKNFAIDDRCAVCGATLEVVILPKPPVRHVGLGSVMVVIAVVAVCLAPMRFAPGMSLLLALISVPAAIRGVIVVERRRLEGRATTAGDVTAIYLTSFFLCAAIAMSAGFAFVMTCVPVGTLLISTQRGGGAGGMIAAVLVGLITAITTLYVVGRKLWPEKD